MSFFQIGSLKLFAWAGLEPRSSYLCLLSRGDYRHEPLALGYISLLKDNPSSKYRNFDYQVSIYHCLFFSELATQFLIK
jgi:hypothetical protein